ncbi:MAG: serine/threonine-protein phosphatase, partial [Bacteroidaceae bacterium]|nr:serine/threonine-protein phosphatase [Bacteroidaceae bacterium]
MVTFDSPNGRVVAVCDGMGGQNAGDVASQLAVTVIQDILTDNTFASPEEAITRSIIAANQAILRRAAQDVSLSGMGATCVMIIIKEGKVYFGSVGDSRIYYIAGGMIRQITKDQSYVQTLVDAGEITQEAAEHHQDKNQITNALGLDGMIPPVIGQMPITPEPGAVFLLCSDGLSGMINNNAILNTVANRQLSLSDRAQQFVNLANAAGGLDNITVQLVEFPGVAPQNVSGYNSNNTSGGIYTNTKRKRNKMPFYAIAACLFACVIGGAIYWFLRDNEPDPIVPKSTISVKEKAVEQRTNKTTVVV